MSVNLPYESDLTWSAISF